MQRTLNVQGKLNVLCRNHGKEARTNLVLVLVLVLALEIRRVATLEMEILSFICRYATGVRGRGRERGRGRSVRTDGFSSIRIRLLTSAATRKTQQPTQGGSTQRPHEGPEPTQVGCFKNERGQMLPISSVFGPSGFDLAGGSISMTMDFGWLGDLARRFATSSFSS
jgi:hypothetical protein